MTELWAIYSKHGTFWHAAEDQDEAWYLLSLRFNEGTNPDARASDDFMKEMESEGYSCRKVEVTPKEE